MADQTDLQRLLLECYAAISSGDTYHPELMADISRALGLRSADDLIPPRTIDLIDQAVVVVLEGDPRGKGRPKFANQGGFVRVYTDKDTADYEQLIQEEVLRIIGGDVLVHNTKQIKRDTFIQAYLDMGGKPLFSCPVRLEMEIRHPVRASWTKAKTAGALNGEIAATIKPDIDNVLKIWCDAFNGCMWKDDTQVIRCTVDKLFAEEPSVLVRVIPLDLLNAGPNPER